MKIAKGTITEFVLVEWNEKTQDFVFNTVSDGASDHPINTAGYAPIMACATHRISFQIIEFLKQAHDLGAAKPKRVSLVKMKASANRLMKLYRQLSIAEKKGWAIAPFK